MFPGGGMAESHERGSAFETAAEELFRAAGFRVDRCRELRGQEYDVIASRHEIGGFETRIAVECKSRNGSAVSNDDVYSFINAFQATQARLGFTHGIIVTDSKFSRQASEAAADVPHIRLVSFASLESELLGSRLYLEGAMKNYRSQIKRRLIDPSADEVVEGRLAPVPRLIDHLLAGVDDGRESFSFLLGDFGSGKTTVAEQVHKALAERYLNQGTGLFPIILYLRNLAQFDTDRSFVAAQLSQHSPSASFELFERMQKGGRCVLILDGLDEVATHATQDERFRLFSRVMRITQQANHLLITSRPTYFNNLAELNGLIRDLTSRDFQTSEQYHVGTREPSKPRGFANLGRRGPEAGAYRLFGQWNTRLFYIRPFSKAHIIDYLSAFEAEFNEQHGLNVDQVYDFLSKTYDLTDLVTRPLLLEMLVEVIIAPGAVRLDDPNIEIGPASLYRDYVALHLNRDWAVRQFLRREERLSFARAAAIAMLDNAAGLEATYESVEKVVVSGLSDIADWRVSVLAGQMESVVNDVRVCAFLNVTANDRIEFSHKSFMEYFVADVIVEKMSKRTIVDEFGKNLNYEILYFVGSHSLIDIDYAINLRDHLELASASQSERYLSNVRMALLYSERVSESKKFSDISLSRALIRKRRFVGCRFERFRISQLSLEEVEFDACQFSATSLTGEIADTAFKSCVGELQLGSVVRRSAMNGCALAVIGHEARLRLDEVTLTNCRLAIDADEITLSRVTMEDVEMAITGDGSVRLENVGMMRSRLTGRASATGSQPPTISIDGTLDDCLIAGFRVSAGAFEETAERLGSCYGVVMVHGSRDALAKIFKRKLDGGQRPPKWLIDKRMVYLAGTKWSLLGADEEELTDIARSGDASAIRKWLGRRLEAMDTAE